MDPLAVFGGAVLFVLSSIGATFMSRRLRQAEHSGEALTEAAVLMFMNILQLMGLAFILGGIFR